MSLLSANDLELFTDVRGSGPPIVLVMGIGVQLTLWEEPFVDRLAAHGFTVVRFDNRDVGLSTHLDHLGLPDPAAALRNRVLRRPVDAPYTLSDMAADVTGLADALGFDRFHVVGASMGGMIAQHVALEAPERLHSLTTIMSSPGNLANLVGHPRAMAALMLQRPTTLDEAMEATLRARRAFHGPVLPFDEDDLRRRIERDLTRSWHPEGGARQFAAILASGNRLPKLPQVQVPSLVLHGTHDPLIPPRASRALARALPRARLHWLPGMGHALAREYWDEMADQIAAHAHASTGQAAA